jgi:hypothetical protein
LFFVQNGFGSPAFYVQTARKVDTADAAIEFLKELEYLGMQTEVFLMKRCTKLRCIQRRRALSGVFGGGGRVTLGNNAAGIQEVLEGKKKT